MRGPGRGTGRECGREGEGRPVPETDAPARRVREEALGDVLAGVDDVEYLRVPGPGAWTRRVHAPPPPEAPPARRRGPVVVRLAPAADVGATGAARLRRVAEEEEAHSFRGAEGVPPCLR